MINLITGIPYEELERISHNKNIIGLYDKEKVEQKILNTRLEGARLKGIEEVKKIKVSKWLKIC